MERCREVALNTMRLTQAGEKLDFLGRNDIDMPVATVVGALPEHARMPFFAPFLSLPVDLVVLFSIGDFVPGKCCSRYYDPDSPWYNVFYGAYGILSHKADGSCWGYDAAGRPNHQELLEVPKLDYNYLTAVQLGCPPAKLRFKVKDLTPDKRGRWDHAELLVTVPSGLHHPEDAVNANPTYYTIFGVPHPDVVKASPSYEPVDLRGHAFFRRATEAAEPITIAWGAAAPDTPAGVMLLDQLVTALARDYFP